MKNSNTRSRRVCIVRLRNVLAVYGMVGTLPGYFLAIQLYGGYFLAVQLYGGSEWWIGMVDWNGNENGNLFDQEIEQQVTDDMTFHVHVQ